MTTNIKDGRRTDMVVRFITWRSKILTLKQTMKSMCIDMLRTTTKNTILRNIVKTQQIIQSRILKSIKIIQMKGKENRGTK